MYGIYHTYTIHIPKIGVPDVKDKTDSQPSWMTRCCFLPASYCCGAIGCKTLTAVLCGLMLLSIKNTKWDPKAASTDDCRK